MAPLDTASRSLRATSREAQSWRRFFVGVGARRVKLLAMRRTLATSLAVLFSVGMFAAGCGDDDPGDDGTSGAGGTPAAGGGAGGTSGGGATSGGTAGLSGGIGAAGAGAAAGAGGGAGGEGGQGGAPADDGLQCRVLSALCAVDSAVAAVQECNELGRAADAGACRQNLQRCVPLCTADEPEPGEGGAGGMSGAGGGGGAAEPLVSPYCIALGELCHAVDEGEGTAHECHEIGHRGEPRTCVINFESCARFCLDALDAPPSSGGAGGSSGSGGSGGAR